MAATKVCPWCEEEFEAARASQKYCRPQHRQMGGVHPGHTQDTWRAAGGWPPKGATKAEKFDWFCDRRGDDDCWGWFGRSNVSGYGIVCGSLAEEGSHKHQMAHRFSYERYVGPIPDGAQVHHRCGNRRCTNPRHLQAVVLSAHRGEDARRRIAEHDLAVALERIRSLEDELALLRGERPKLRLAAVDGQLVGQLSIDDVLAQ